MPLIGMRLTLQITLIPIPTGWTVCLSKHFPDTPTIPTPPPPTPIRLHSHSLRLHGGNRTFHLPLPLHRSGSQDNQAGSLNFNHRRRQTTSDSFYSSTYRMEGSPEKLLRFRYIHPIRYLNHRLNDYRIEPSIQSYSSYPTQSQSSTPRTQSSRSSGRYIRFNSPRLGNQS